MGENSYIPYLSELTARLSKVPKGTPVYELVLGDGESPPMTGRALFKNNEIAIMEVSFPNGSVFPEHRHNEMEWLICFHGKIDFSANGETVIMEPGTCLYMPPGQAHKSVALEDSKTIVITIPAGPEFPDVRK